MINIAHEAPISLMSQVRGATSYDYALACLFDKIPGYYDYFEDAIKNKRHVILDNGVFEDGVPMPSDQYATWIEKLKPAEYIVPDEFDKTGVTISYFENWLKQYGDLPGGKIGVIQGTNFSEMFGCYDYMANKADKVAINFASIAYQNFASQLFLPENTWDYKAVYGRVNFIYNLITTGVYNDSKPHHLLGCSLPLEFTLLKRTNVNNHRLLDYFESMDTSAPVVWGILTGKYPINLDSITKKNKTKLKDLITAELSPQQVDDIMANIALFHMHLI